MTQRLTERTIPRLVCQALPHGPWGGGAYWYLCFGWPESGESIETAYRGTLIGIAIDGLLPEQIHSIRVQAGSRVLFRVESSQGRSGHVTTAGELLHAMAGLSGQAGLRIDSEYLDADAPMSPLLMHLQVCADEADSLSRVRVRVLARTC